ncbi:MULTISPECIES: hypothetical protein [Aquincola]|uniref:hypothetical protein n=1 Tax=Aquincola TaxID=391952 RepID=UPI0012ED4E59|nr:MULTISPECIES: hypothetical protein [Aquincola]MCR5867655.1 hypothetical protein [Aquincola sp. J276]
MQFNSNALRFCPASVGALMDTGFLRSVLHDVEDPTHPDGALAQPGPDAAAPRPLRSRWRGLLHAISGHRPAAAADR